MTQEPDKPLHLLMQKEVFLTKTMDSVQVIEFWTVRTRLPRRNFN